ncbi:MAG TPA: AmmeMemoRadiSam system protein B [Candidatus Binatia bacterium]|nr:AmmeMemoRadiSam system protein B [Candidatus Binatia bacterium]
MSDRPRLRPVEAFPVQQNGQTVIYLKDPLNLAPAIGISPLAYFIASHFDGQHSFIDIQEAYSRQFGTLLVSDDLKAFVDALDRHYYLWSDRFFAYQNQIVEEFRGMSIRPAAHAGSVYKKDAEELKAQLDGYFEAPEGPGRPAWNKAGPPPKAIVAPHIDFARGGAGYAWAYRRLAESEGADVYILLGTSHCSGRNFFILTAKDFETPLGAVAADKAFIRELDRRCRQDLFVDEYLHRGEHSLEFQIVYLKYVARRRAELAGIEEKPFTIVPILVSSFHPMVQGGVLPEREPSVAAFLEALRELSVRETRRVCFVAGVDLAHVGAQFGDRETVSSDFLAWVGAEDRRLIERLRALDAPGFFNEIAKDQDRRRICGFSPLYSLIHLLDGSEGRTLKYSQAFTPETGSAVTFTSMVFE